MANEHTKDELAALVGDFAEHMAVIADLQRQRAQLSASATAAHGRVKITVNADGTVIDTQLTDIGDLTESELARAVTEAAQQAALAVGRKAGELMNPLRQLTNRLPKLSDIIEDMPDLDEHIPQPPPVPLTPEELRLDQADEESRKLVFTDVEYLDPDHGQSGIIDRG